jgi:hypothetical protein
MQSILAVVLSTPPFPARVTRPTFVWKGKSYFDVENAYVLRLTHCLVGGSFDQNWL